MSNRTAGAPRARRLSTARTSPATFSAFKCHLAFLLCCTAGGSASTMAEQLTGQDISFIELQTAVFCVECELISKNNTPCCLACGSRAVMSLSRVLGGSLRGQQTAHLIADAELDRLVRSLLYTVPQTAETSDEREERRASDNLIELPA